MVKFHAIILSLVLVLLAGCACKQSELEAYRQLHPFYKEVKVPVKCTVPKTDCSIDQNATEVEVVQKLLECIYDLKQASKVCQ